MNKKLKYNLGYTLIELLVVLALFGIITVFLSSIFATSFQVSNQIKTMSSIRQDGSNSLDEISRTISNALYIYGVSSDGNTFTCSQNKSGSYIKILNPDNSQSVIQCGYSDNSKPNIAILNPLYLFLNDNISKLELSGDSDSCNTAFTCIAPPNANYPSAIKINFEVSQPYSGALVENRESAVFNTTVFIQNNLNITPTPNAN